jgi:iron-sulfur cluster repair protein YtfE (RIC family)
MNPEQVRLQLLAHHTRLRAHLDTCTRLARLAGPGPDAALDAALALLREAFAAHNEAETAIIGELLHGPASWGKLLIDRMLEEHVAEHATFWELLSGTPAEVASRIDELADELEGHMAAEERTFLAPGTLREDVLRTRTGSPAPVVVRSR